MPPPEPRAPQSETFIKVSLFSAVTKATKPLSYVQFDTGGTTDPQLHDIRKALSQKNAVNTKRLRFPFCTPQGTKVEDTLTYSKYASLFQQDTTASDQKPTDAKGTGSTAADSKTPGAALQVYLYESASATPPSDQTTEILNEKLRNMSIDTTLRKDATHLDKATDIKELVSSYVASSYTASATGTVSQPADMVEKDWDAVFQHNGILCGYRYVIESLQKPKSTGTSQKTEELRTFSSLERVPRPAFAIKRRAIELFKAAAVSAQSPKVQPPPSSSSTQPSTQRTISATDQAIYTQARIPRFNVADGSTVDVFQTKNQMATAMARSAFTETEAEAAIGGGFAGFNATAQAGMKKEDRDAVTNASSKSSNYIHISYNFPRVVVFLDRENLELSQDCKNEIKKLCNSQKPHSQDPTKTVEKTTQDEVKEVMAFMTSFGYFIPTRLQLGGRLYSSEVSENAGTTVSRSESHALKVAASLSFASPWVQASVRASHEKAESSQQSAQTSSLSKSISWEAEGGNTLLCNNPPAWCPTVGSHYNWRVMKQDGVVPVMQLILDILSEGDADMKRLGKTLYGVVDRVRQFEKIP